MEIWPDVVQDLVAQYLTVRDYTSLASTCTYFYNFLGQNTSWWSRCQKDFPTSEYQTKYSHQDWKKIYKHYFKSSTGIYDNVGCDRNNFYKSTYSMTEVRDLGFGKLVCGRSISTPNIALTGLKIADRIIYVQFQVQFMSDDLWITYHPIVIAKFDQDGYLPAVWYGGNELGTALSYPKPDPTLSIEKENQAQEMLKKYKPEPSECPFVNGIYEYETKSSIKLELEFSFEFNTVIGWKFQGKTHEKVQNEQEKREYDEKCTGLVTEHYITFVKESWVHGGNHMWDTHPVDWEFLIFFIEKGSNVFQGLRFTDWQTEQPTICAAKLKGPTSKK